jgi:hypothetical protein
MKITDKIFESYGSRNQQDSRTYLGGSAIGDECERKLWYNFRWAKKPEFIGRMHRLFNYGHRLEDVLVDELRDAGITVYQHDEDGEQFAMKAVRGHFGGHADGKGIGFPGKENVMHLLEFKSHNHKSFAKLEKEGVRKSKPIHFAQCQVYMGLLGLERAYYLAENKDNSDLYEEYIDFDEVVFKSLGTKAKRIIESPVAPDRLSESPAFWICRWCDFKDICHGDEIPSTNCRTCAHSTPVDDGQWLCEIWGKNIPEDISRRGCDLHVFNPSMIAMQEIYGDDGYVVYDHDGLKISNCTSREFPVECDVYMTSKEMSAAKYCKNLASIDLVKKEFGAEVVVDAD